LFGTGEVGCIVEDTTACRAELVKSLTCQPLDSNSAESQHGELRIMEDMREVEESLPAEKGGAGQCHVNKSEGCEWHAVEVEHEEVGRFEGGELGVAAREAGETDVAKLEANLSAAHLSDKEQSTNNEDLAGELGCQGVEVAGRHDKFEIGTAVAEEKELPSKPAAHTTLMADVIQKDAVPLEVCHQQQQISRDDAKISIESAAFSQLEIGSQTEAPACSSRTGALEDMSGALEIPGDARPPDVLGGSGCPGGSEHSLIFQVCELESGIAAAWNLKADQTSICRLESDASFISEAEVGDAVLDAVGACLSVADKDAVLMAANVDLPHETSGPCAAAG